MATCSSPTTARTCSRTRRTRRGSRRNTATTWRAPKNYKEFGDIACFLTEKYQPKIYGAGVINTGYTFFFFSERFRNYGGRFFDPETMKATVNSEAGLKALTEMVEQNKCMSPGIETWGFAENLSALNAGEIAMTISWPPLGRWAQGVNIDDKALVLGAEDHGRRQGRLCHQSRRPSGTRFGLHLRRLARQQEQGCGLSLCAVDALQDPEPAERDEAGRVCAIRSGSRTMNSPEYQNLWPGAKDYLKVLKDGAAAGYADFSFIETFKYQDAMSRAVSAAIGGEDPKAALDAMAAEWDQITESVGVDKQREAYKVWAAKPSAYRE